MDELFEKLFRSLHDRYAVTTIVIGKATEITDTTCTVTRDEQPELKEVRLHSIVSDLETFIRIKPKEGSYVLAGIIESDITEAVILATSEIDNILVKIGDLQLELDGNKFLFKKGNENLGRLMSDTFDAMLSERHMTNTGVTINLTPDSIAAYNNLKTRFENFLKDV